ncbi:MAG: AraC family transcriptional regulator [Thermoleophilaceae bacterium]|nr:AraC family transcriptional regulator [Thermoleophilaceae bacterium]MEA2470100.1 AraC family transcriptional regulator [Thermoleophilaceae bacterium]
MPYTLTGADGVPFTSKRPGAFGGHRRGRGYGRDWSAAPWRRLRVESPFDADHMLAYLRARAIPGVECVEDSVYRRTLSLPHGPALVELDIREDAVRLRLPACDSRDRRAATTRARRLLGLDQDLAPARAAFARDALLGPLVAARPGLTVPGTVDGSELLIRAIVHQQVSLAAARTVLGRLVEDHGGTAFGARLFPTSETLAALSPGELPMPAARARALIAAAAASPATVQGLLALTGVGDWTASYVAMRALRDPDAFPATDLGIRRALERLGRPDPERWRPFRAYAAQHLWASALH